MSTKPDKLLQLLSDPDDREALENQYLNCNFLRSVIRDYLEKEIDKLVLEEENSTSFDKPGWSERQASLIGERKGLRRMLKLMGEDPLNEGGDQSGS